MMKSNSEISQVLLKYRHEMDQSKEIFETIVDKAIKAFDCKRSLQSTVWSRLAAEFAWLAHPGQYTSPPLEEVLANIAGNLTTNKMSIVQSKKSLKYSKRRVLHVLTEAYDTGGHTRVVEKWIINASTDNVHSVVITGSGTTTPNWLLDAVARSGGTFYRLCNPFWDMLQRARELRLIAGNCADVVVSHAHPLDPIPSLAFGTPNAPPVLVFNHADHVFWLGSSMADMVADIRMAGQTLTLQRRGIEKSMILPIPLTDVAKINKKDARISLGVADSDIVLLTIASSYKYTPFGECDFLETLEKVVQRNKRVLVLAIGPNSAGRWAEYEKKTDGRIRALGVKKDLSVFHAAADIYLDSFPCASLTATLEAGLTGLPIICFSNPFSHLFSGNDVSLCDNAIFAETVDQYLYALESGIVRCQQMGIIGENIRERILNDHCGISWERSANEVLENLPKKHSLTYNPKKIGVPGNDDIFLAAFQQKSNGTRILEDCYSRNLQHFSLLDRLQIVMRLNETKNFPYPIRMPLKACLGNTSREIFRRIIQHAHR